MDRLQSMRAFVKVIEHGGFARAARAMDLSDAVVTRLVADLETHLNTRLLNRTTRKLSLTESGAAYLERVRQILHDIDDAEAAAVSISSQASGTLRLYSHLGFGQYQLSQLLPRFKAAHPAIVLDVMYSDRTVDLVEEGFDVGIFIGILQQFDTSMVARQLGITQAMLVASPAYVRQHGAPATPADLVRHACLNHPFEQTRHHWSLHGHQGVVQVPITSYIIANNGELLRDCALAGMGILIMPSFVVANDLAAGRLVRILPDYHLGQLPVTLAYPSRRLLSSKVRMFVDFMSSIFPHPERDAWCLHQRGC